MTGKPDNGDGGSLDEELLNIIAGQVRFSPYTIILSMGIVAFMIYRHVPDQTWVWGGWLAAVVITQVYRIYRLPKLPGETHKPAAERAREAAQINFVGSFIQCLSLAAFPLFTPFEAAVQTMMFIGMGVGSIVTAVGWKPFTLTHVMVCLLPMFALWGWSGVYGQAGTLGILVALVGVAYSATMWMIGKRLYRMNQDFFANRTALAHALDEAQRAGAAKTRFLAAASHDLRQPIHTLALFSSALNMRPLDTRAQHISENIDGAVKALSFQLDALLDMSKLDAGIVPVKNEKVDLSAMLERMGMEFSAPAEAAAISLSIRCPPQAVVATDQALLERIIHNVLSNAIAYNSDCPLDIAVVRSADTWLLTLSDGGVGIPAVEHQHIFEEFYQIENPERDRSKGLGLGLPIVARLSKLLELDMQFSSEPGRGTSFSFAIPASASKVNDSREETQRAGPLSGIKVLAIDDEITVQEGMKVLLELLGCEVLVAGGTDSALAEAREVEPDIALVDYRLGGSDSGINTIVQLRQLYPDLPAIIISGDTGPDRLQEARATGVMLLSKPVDRDSLLDAIAITCNR